MVSWSELAVLTVAWWCAAAEGAVYRVHSGQPSVIIASPQARQFGVVSAVQCGLLGAASRATAISVTTKSEENIACTVAPPSARLPAVVPGAPAPGEVLYALELEGPSSSPGVSMTTEVLTSNAEAATTTTEAATTATEAATAATEAATAATEAATAATEAATAGTEAATAGTEAAAATAATEAATAATEAATAATEAATTSTEAATATTTTEAATTTTEAVTTTATSSSSSTASAACLTAGDIDCTVLGPDTYYYHPNDCSRYLMCDGKPNPSKKSCPTKTFFDLSIPGCTDSQPEKCSCQTSV